jgi:hypothetical protein
MVVAADIAANLSAGSTQVLKLPLSSTPLPLITLMEMGFGRE